MKRTFAVYQTPSKETVEILKELRVNMKEIRTDVNSRNESNWEP